MLKLAILLTAATLGLAQSGNETEASKESQNVTSLDLSNQGMTSLNDYDFSKYPLLSSVDLSNNNLTHINEKTFTENINLKQLNLSGNPQLHIPEYSTLLIANIEELDLSRCNIKELPQNVFDGLVDLKKIDLSGNPLGENAIKVATLLNLMSPKTVILPHTEEKLIKEICNDLDITVEVKEEYNVDSIKCADVRDGTWTVPNKENQTSKNDEEVKSNPDEIPPAEPQITLTNATESKNEEQPVVPAVEAEVSSENPEKQVINETDSGLSAHNDSTAPLLPLEEPVPDVVDNATKISPEEGHPPIDDHQEVKPQENISKEGQTPPPEPLQRSAIDVPVDKVEEKPTKTDNAPIPSEQNKLEKMEEKKAADVDDMKTGASTESNMGTNILVFLVVAVVIAGVGAFGYKFYKTRKYQAARSSEPMERELKEIVVDKKSNGASKLVDTIEEEPLMEKHENSVEIKEVDEAKERSAPAQNDTPKAASQDSTTEITTNAAAQNQTATPAKPPHVKKDENKS